jgi:hypothetical protein
LIDFQNSIFKLKFKIGFEIQKIKMEQKFENRNSKMDFENQIFVPFLKIDI